MRLSSRPMKVLVTGATGFVGRHLLPRLERDGHSLVVLSRSEHPNLNTPSSVPVFCWRPEEAPPPLSALEGVDAVVHLAGESVMGRWSSEVKRRIHDSRVIGTRNLIEGMRRAGARGPKTLVSASAIGFYGDRGDEILNERSPSGSGFLAGVCVEWEREAQRFSSEVGGRVAIVRVGIVLGRDGGAMEKLAPLYRKALGGPLGDGRHWMPWIHIEDLVSIFAEAVSKTDWTGPINGVGPHPSRNVDFSDVLAKTVHRPAVFKTPHFVLKLALGEVADFLLWSQRVIPDRAERLGYRFQYPELAPALREICGESH